MIRVALFAAVALTIGGTAQAQRVSNVTGRTLMSACAGKQVQACDAYVDGFGDAVEAGGKDHALACIPRTSTGTELRDVLTTYLRSHPEDQSLKAGTIATPGFRRRLSLQEMTRRRITSGSTFERDIGYARAVVEGDWVFVSGTTGFDYPTMTIADDVVEQAKQALANIGAALAEAGAGFSDVVRVRYLLPDRADFELCWPILRGCFGAHPPAATMMLVGLSDPRMRIEIEVTARQCRRQSIP